MKTISKKIQGLKGALFIPGDKSISHRALMLGSVARGTTKITGLLESEDVLRTAEAMQKLGAVIEKKADGSWEVTGAKQLKEPESVLDMGNAGTGTRLLMGLVASHAFKTSFTGDASLCSRPMNRVMDPLSRCGAFFDTSDGGKLPLTVTGTKNPKPYSYQLNVASAQVKSAVLLSGLNINGKTTIIEPFSLRSRDHTERMLAGFGADLEINEDIHKNRVITINGKAQLHACDIFVPSDVSSAAFPIVAALITPNSDILLPNIGINPFRSGILTVLRQMGGDIVFENERHVAGEPVADIRVRSSTLKGIEVPAEIAPSMIDEYPVLAVASAFAEGTTVMNGLEELKVKESNRFQAIIDGLNKNSVFCEGKTGSKPDETRLIIHGNGKNPCGGGLIEAKLDHRIAMSFLVMGMASQSPVLIDDISSVATSFPGFIKLMNKAGADIHDYCD